MTLQKITSDDISNTTGSGSVVLSNSPTLGTPNIGVANGTSLALSGDFSPSTCFSFRNKLINGNQIIAQRGDKVISANGVSYGGADRFAVFTTNFTTISGTISRVTGLQTPSSYAQGFINVTSTGSAGVIEFRQRIESIHSVSMNSKTVTLSAYVFQNTGSNKNAYLKFSNPTALDNFTTETTLSISNAFSIPSNNWVRISFTITLGSSDCTNGLAVTAYFDNLPALTNNRFYISCVQLEEGSVATPFENRSVSVEMNDCQRYYQSVSGMFSGSYQAAAIKTLSLTLPSWMRSGGLVTQSYSWGNGATGRSNTSGGPSYSQNTIIDIQTISGSASGYLNGSYVIEAEL